jgi:4-hydroxybenzoate polyprenyltransferase and related prenyltransferases
MKLIGAFFQLIRWQNLLFIALNQLLYYYCIYLPLIHIDRYKQLFWLLSASILIAAAGYIINDYFDLNIDLINKPNKNVFGKRINRRWAIIWHFILSFLGIIATALAVGIGKWYLIAANIGCVVLLWVYSTSFKKRLLIGNVIISLLTSWTLLILFFAFTEPRHAFAVTEPVIVRLFRISFLYAGFAFIISLIREAIKDMEDMEGDTRYGCKTLPIVAGIRSTKVYVTVWNIVLLGSVSVLQLYIMQFGWWFAIIYSILFIIIPLVMLQQKLFNAFKPKEFSYLSNLSKLIMLSGILSMIFFKIYF